MWPLRWACQPNCIHAMSGLAARSSITVSRFGSSWASEEVDVFYEDGAPRFAGATSLGIAQPHNYGVAQSLQVQILGEQPEHVADVATPLDARPGQTAHCKPLTRPGRRCGA